MQKIIGLFVRDMPAVWDKHSRHTILGCQLEGFSLVILFLLLVRLRAIPATAIVSPAFAKRGESKGLLSFSTILFFLRIIAPAEERIPAVESPILTVPIVVAFS